MIVFDLSGFPKKGEASVGVQRQWLGRLGKVDKGQVGVFIAFTSYRDHALVDVRLYLPKGWAKDRARRKRYGIPKSVRYRTRHELALEMFRETGPLLPHAWISGDDEMGRSSRFRAELRRLGEHYLLAVPSNTTVRDLDGETPEWGGRGRRPKRAFEQARTWSKSLPTEALTPSKKRTDVTAKKRIMAPWAVILPAIPPRLSRRSKRPESSAAGLWIVKNAN